MHVDPLTKFKLNYATAAVAYDLIDKLFENEQLPAERGRIAELCTLLAADGSARNDIPTDGVEILSDNICCRHVYCETIWTMRPYRTTALL